MLFQYIEKLRGKPERVKKQIAFLFSFAVTGIIFVVWLSFIYPDFRHSQSAKDTTNTASPVSAFSDIFSSGISAIVEQFGRIQEMVTSSAYYVSTTSPE